MGEFTFNTSLPIFNARFLGTQPIRYDELGSLDRLVGQKYVENQGKLEYKEPIIWVSDTTVKEIVDVILQEAIDLDATDIMILPQKEYAVVFLAIEERQEMVRLLHPGSVIPIITYMQYLSNVPIGKYYDVDISGQIRYNYLGQDYNLRVAFVPTMHGPSVDARLLSKKGIPPLEKLGLPQDVEHLLKEMSNSKDGITLFCGGTSSGKTTTIASLMQYALQKSNYGRKLYTIENPIEYPIPLATQTQVNDVADIGFKKLLQASLRYKPDIILVGEINDAETAQTATRASNSGHLIYSTLHANNVLSVPGALMHYGIDENEVYTSMRAVVYQTLEKKLCPHCKQARVVSMQQKHFLDNHLLTTEEVGTIYEAKEGGCPHCNNSGYKGVVLLVEFVTINLVFRDLENEIKNNSGTVDDLKRELLVTDGVVYYPLEHDVMRRLKDGDIDYRTVRKLVGK